MRIRKPNWPLVRFATWMIALVILYFDKFHARQSGQFGRDCGFAGIGILLLAGTVLDIRIGNSSLGLSTYERRKDPTGFWTWIAINGALGGVFLIGALGDMLGLWRF